MKWWFASRPEQKVDVASLLAAYMKDNASEAERSRIAEQLKLSGDETRKAFRLLIKEMTHLVSRGSEQERTTRCPGIVRAIISLGDAETITDAIASCVDTLGGMDVLTQVRRDGILDLFAHANAVIPFLLVAHRQQAGNSSLSVINNAMEGKINMVLEAIGRPALEPLITFIENPSFTLKDTNRNAAVYTAECIATRIDPQWRSSVSRPIFSSPNAGEPPTRRDTKKEDMQPPAGILPNTRTTLVDLPDPLDADSLERMEAQLTQTIGNLCDNSRLRDIISFPPWGWHPAAITTKDSPSRARILAVTKLGRLLGRKALRISDAQFRIRFSLEGTSWDKDFGSPTSVLRIEVAAKAQHGGLGSPAWLSGVAVGRTTANEFLVWEWET